MRIGIIGAGNMGRAIITGILEKGLFKADEIIVSDIDTKKLEGLKVKTTNNNLDVLTFADDGIIIAVKPYVLESILGEIREGIKGHHIISIAAGIKTGFIEEKLPNARIVRVMPNIPLVIGCGISAIAKGTYADDSDIAFAKRIFGALGEVVEIEEPLMDAVTSLSGSCPAYIFLIIDTLISVGVRMGLSRNIAERLVLSTISGSVKLVEKTKEHPCKLRDMVMSPGGTTAAGFEILEKKGLSGILWEAVLASHKRAKELG